MCHHGYMAINETTAKHARRHLKNRELSSSELTQRLNQEVSGPAYDTAQIESMLRQMQDVEEHDGKFRLKTREDVNQAAARIVREATEG
jgi:hypothetical protein